MEAEAEVEEAEADDRGSGTRDADDADDAHGGGQARSSDADDSCAGGPTAVGVPGAPRVPGESMDDLHAMMAARRQREEDVETMKVRVHAEMVKTMDVGVRVNPALARLYGVAGYSEGDSREERRGSSCTDGGGDAEPRGSDAEGGPSARADDAAPAIVASSGTAAEPVNLLACDDSDSDEVHPEPERDREEGTRSLPDDSMHEDEEGEAEDALELLDW